MRCRIKSEGASIDYKLFINSVFPCLRPIDLRLSHLPALQPKVSVVVSHLTCHPFPSEKSGPKKKSKRSEEAPEEERLLDSQHPDLADALSGPSAAAASES